MGSQEPDLITALSAQPMHVLLHGGCQVEVQSNPTVTGHCYNQIVNQNVTYELGMGAYCCISAFRGWEEQQLEHQGQTDSKLQKKNDFSQGTFPIIVINCPVKRILNHVPTFQALRNIGVIDIHRIG